MADDVDLALALLDAVIPFQFVPAARRRALAARLERRTYADGDTILRQGERSRELHLLARGTVDVVGEGGRRLPAILEGHYFGERAALFDEPRRVTVVARGAVTTWCMTGKDFLELIDEVPVFAQALASTLKVKQGIFLQYRRMYARLLGLLDRREFLLTELLPAYAALSPALHPALHEPRVDVGALGYAIARLPGEVTRTTFYYLTGTLPLIYSDPDRKFDAVPTKARRRAAWRAMPGKLIVLLRDGITDVTDLLTCLCVYAYEARKLRHRLRETRLLDDVRALGAGARERAQVERALADLPLDEGERAGLLGIWGDDTLERLRDVLLHHEDIAVECDLQLDDYNSRAAETWVSQIRARARSFVDLEDPDLDVHIISSNTHSVSNCLSPGLHRRRDAILAWGRQHRADLAGPPTPERPWGGGWANRDDLLYVTARHWLRAHPEEAARVDAEEEAAGHHRLTSTAFTGIEVDLFDLRRLDPALADGAVGARRPTRPTVLVNVDYAFGQQAEEILANLLFTFGRRVRSVSVLGKAGGLVGHRGHLLLPTATLLQTNDELYPIPNCDLPPDLLRGLANGLPVHVGPVLTVAGTLLQDRMLLHFYRRIWKCVGLEMEGSFFARQLVSAIETGVVDPGVKARFAYYTSDVPLDPEENLSAALAPWEGVPPLYAITRAVLQRVFAGG